MKTYENEDYKKIEIMEQSRHLFVYGTNDEHRSSFLRSLEKSYPVQVDSNKPIALYFDSLGMPKVEDNLNDKNNYLIRAASREYLSFAVATRILEKSLEFDGLDSRLSRLINIINNSKNTDYTEIKTSQDLLKEIKSSRDFYYEKYIKYIKGLVDGINIKDITIPFLSLEMFVKLYKEGMDIDSYIGIIFDKKNPIAISSTQSINNLIGSRINKDISIKVSIEPNDWETYIDANGQIIETIHDYGTVELDNSYEENIKRLSKQIKNG